MKPTAPPGQHRGNTSAPLPCCPVLHGNGEIARISDRAIGKCGIKSLPVAYGQSAVDRLVVGSNPTARALSCSWQKYGAPASSRDEVNPCLRHAEHDSEESDISSPRVAATCPRIAHDRCSRVVALACPPAAPARLSSGVLPGPSTDVARMDPGRDLGRRGYQ